MMNQESVLLISSQLIHWRVDIIVGTGGARKIRWAANNYQGKSGGVRIIYYYHNQAIPVFLFTAYGKNKKANLPKAERNMLRVLIGQLVKTYEGS